MQIVHCFGDSRRIKFDKSYDSSMVAINFTDGYCNKILPSNVQKVPIFPLVRKYILENQENSKQTAIEIQAVAK